MTRKLTPAQALANAGERVRRAVAERDNLIVDIVAAGEMTSQREIARAVGLSHTAIQQILRRADAAAEEAAETEAAS